MSIGQKEIHHNGNLAGLKGLALRSRSHSARYVVDIYGKWHNGDAEEWCHRDMCEYEEGKILGYVFYEIDHFTYIAEMKSGGNYYGPETDRLESYGIVRRPYDDTGFTIFPGNEDLGIIEDGIAW